MEDNPGEIEDLTLPEVFPTAQEVHLILRDAVRACIGVNVLRPLSDTLTPVLGDAADIFNDPIMFRDVGIEGSLDLFQGYVPIQQLFGRILYNEDVMKAFLGNRINPLVNSNSMVNTNIYRGFPEQVAVNHVLVEHKMPTNLLVRRYLRNTDTNIRVDGDFMTIQWGVSYDDTNMSGLTRVVEQLGAALTIYYKLLTRFPSCQSYQSTLPGFRSS